jgi:hypothetical protein
MDSTPDTGIQSILSSIVLHQDIDALTSALVVSLDDDVALGFIHRSLQSLDDQPGGPTCLAHVSALIESGIQVLPHLGSLELVERLEWCLTGCNDLPCHGGSGSELSHWFSFLQTIQVAILVYKPAILVENRM